MGRSEKDNEEIRAARRHEILSAATAVFAKKGLARTKVGDIAAAANLSHGLLYHYFPSKEAVFEAIVERLMEHTAEDLSAANGRAIDRLRQLVTASRQRMDDETLDESRVVTLAMLLTDNVSPALRERLAAFAATLLEQTTAIIAEAQADGDVDPSISPDELSNLLFFLFRGMALRVPGMTVPLPGAASILDLLLPPPRAPEESSP